MKESDVEAATASWRQSAQSAVGVPEIAVTLNMLNHADALGYDLCGEQYAAIYRAMAAVAPVDLYTTNVAESARIAALEADNAALTGELARAQATATHLYEECRRLADGPPTQHSPEYVAKVLMDREGRYNDPFAHARLTEVIRCARLDGRKQARDEAKRAVFTADQPDLPDPPRRPDGTLMPQPKALTVPRETGDKRRVGS